MKNPKVVLYQNGKAKIQADNVNELVTALYRGLAVQKKIGKRFLNLGTTTKIVLPTKNDKFIHLQKISAGAFNETQMVELVNFLNS